MHPSKAICLTTSSDGQSRIWGLHWDSSTGVNNAAPSWTCLSAGLYRAGDVKALSSDWSRDGSLVAITYHNTVTLWDPHGEGLALRSVLSYAPSNEQLIGVKFLRVPSGLLVTWSRTRIYVWDLVRSAVLWSLKLPIKDVVVDERTGRLLVHSRVQVTTEGTPSPIPYSTPVDMKCRESEE